MQVFLDIDGVLADFVGGVCKRLNAANPYDNICNWGEFDIVKLLGVEPHFFWSQLGYAFWRSLRPTDEYLRILNAVHDFTDNIVLCTSPCKTIGCMDGKEEWVRLYLPNNADSIVFSRQKWRLAAPGKLLIDDCERNCFLWEVGGGKAILVPRRWNSLARVDTVEYVKGALQCLKNTKQ